MTGQWWRRQVMAVGAAASLGRGRGDGAGNAGIVSGVTGVQFRPRLCTAATIGCASIHCSTSMRCRRTGTLQERTGIGKRRNRLRPRGVRIRRSSLPSHRRRGVDRRPAGDAGGSAGGPRADQLGDAALGQSLDPGCRIERPLPVEREATADQRHRQALGEWSTLPRRRRWMTRRPERESPCLPSRQEVAAARGELFGVVRAAMAAELEKFMPQPRPASPPAAGARTQPVVAAAHRDRLPPPSRPLRSDGQVERPAEEHRAGRAASATGRRRVDPHTYAAPVGNREHELLRAHLLAGAEPAEPRATSPPRRGSADSRRFASPHGSTTPAGPPSRRSADPSSLNGTRIARTSSPGWSGHSPRPAQSAVAPHHQ